MFVALSFQRLSWPPITECLHHRLSCPPVILIAHSAIGKQDFLKTERQTSHHERAVGGSLGRALSHGNEGVDLGAPGQGGNGGYEIQQGAHSVGDRSKVDAGKAQRGVCGGIWNISSWTVTVSRFGQLDPGIDF